MVTLARQHQLTLTHNRTTSYFYFVYISVSEKSSSFQEKRAPDFVIPCSDFFSILAIYQIKTCPIICLINLRRHSSVLSSLIAPDDYTPTISCMKPSCAMQATLVSVVLFFLSPLNHRNSELIKPGVHCFVCEYSYSLRRA